MIKGIVIQGPRASGKTRLARMVGECYDKVIEIYHTADLRTYKLLGDDTDCAIIEERDPSALTNAGLSTELFFIYTVTTEDYSNKYPSELLVVNL